MQAFPPKIIISQHFFFCYLSILICIIFLFLLILKKYPIPFLSFWFLTELTPQSHPILKSYICNPPSISYISCAIYPYKVTAKSQLSVSYRAQPRSFTQQYSFHVPLFSAWTRSTHIFCYTQFPLLEEIFHHTHKLTNNSPNMQ